jgi:hypothetical protein
MSWRPNEREIASVVMLTGPDRYSYLIKKMVDQHVVWSLWCEGGWALASAVSGRELVPVWPHPNYAILSAKGAWNGCLPKSISLNEWLDRWVPGTEQDGRLVAAFPTPADTGVEVSPRQMERDIRIEMNRYD